MSLLKHFRINNLRHKTKEQSSNELRNQESHIFSLKFLHCSHFLRKIFYTFHVLMKLNSLVSSHNRVNVSWFTSISCCFSITIGEQSNRLIGFFTLSSPIIYQTLGSVFPEDSFMFKNKLSLNPIMSPIICCIVLTGVDCVT